MKSEILTNHINPPIPIRQYDWEAFREDYDEGGIIAYGRTEEEAIKNLLEAEKEEQL